MHRLAELCHLPSVPTRVFRGPPASTSLTACRPPFVSQVRGHLAPPVWWGKGGTASLGAGRTFSQGFLNAWQSRGQRCFIELIGQLIIPGDTHQ